MKLTRSPLLLALLVVCVLAISFYVACLSTLAGEWLRKVEISKSDRTLLRFLQQGFQQCVREKGLGLRAIALDECRVSLEFPKNTQQIWRDPKSGQLEGLTYTFNLCKVASLWEQVRNSSTILTKEYINALPHGWHDYAWKRINKGYLLNKCTNTSLCEEKLRLVLPSSPPFRPRQFGHCAVVGNSGDLLRTQFGADIDTFDAVIRANGAPVQNYTRYVGKKCTFRLLNRGSAKALDKVAVLDETGKEVLIVKTTIHDIMSTMIREIPIRNPVYLLLGMPLGASAKGTGLQALEFALSVCETVDIFGFTVDPGYTEWTRYFSEARKGHTPLQGRAYYQMMECLGLITIHSPKRAISSHVVQMGPSRSVLEAARRQSAQIWTSNNEHRQSFEIVHSLGKQDA